MDFLLMAAGFRILLRGGYPRRYKEIQELMDYPENRIQMTSGAI